MQLTQLLPIMLKTNCQYALPVAAFLFTVCIQKNVVIAVETLKFKKQSILKAHNCHGNAAGD